MKKPKPNTSSDYVRYAAECQSHVRHHEAEWHIMQNGQLVPVDISPNDQRFTPYRVGDGSVDHGQDCRLSTLSHCSCGLHRALRATATKER
jgi:hypothetical protein